MDQYLKNNTIIVCPDSIKKDILLNSKNNLIQVKFLTIKELVNSVFFTYDKEAIFYLMNKLNIKYEIAKIYMDNLVYINDDVKTEKLLFLKSIKEKLIEKYLLIFDDLFLTLIKNFNNLVVYGYDYLTKLQKYALDIISKSIDVIVIDNEEGTYLPEVIELPSMDLEIEYVAKKISNLINNNIDINKIKLTNVSEDYLNTIEKIFKIYNIPININNKINIFSSYIGTLFIENYSSNLEETLEKIKNNIDLKNETNLNIYNLLIKVINDYTFVQDKLKVKELIINDLKNTFYKTYEYKNSVSIIDFKNYIFKDDEYVFMLNFNLNNIPVNYKDEEYISDKEKTNILLETTKEKNMIEKKTVINKIKTIKNLIITYKNKTAFEKYYPSSLINDLNLKVIKKEKLDLDSYSYLADKLNLSKKLDNLIKYGIIDNQLNIYYNSFKEIPYLKYDNSFTGIDKRLLKEYIGNKLSLSYSNIDNYYRCSFKYYLANILKLDIFEEKFSTFIGSLFHHILELALKENIDIDNEINKYITASEKQLDAKEEFFLHKLRKELDFIIKTIKKQQSYSNLKNVLYENKIYVNKDNEIPVVFSGIIDKLLYKQEDDKTIIAIIDYKTGNTDIDLKLNKYGIGMQLPIYLYLAKNNKRFINPTFAGFYLQKILNNEITIDQNKTYEQQKENNLKLSGYSTNNQEILNEFDNTYSSSLVINSMKTKNDGNFYNYSKVLTSNEMEALYNNVDNKIDEAATNIINAKFDINPKYIGYGKKANVGCEFCKFKDICYMNDKNFKYLEEIKDLSYLGGDNNA